MSEGSTLIEILISLFLFSLMLLGLDAVQITALREAKAAYYFAVANQQLRVIKERLLTLHDNDNTEQISIWNRQNHEVLPQGSGVVEGHYPEYLVTLYWGKRNSNCDKNIVGQSGCLKEKISY